MVVMERRNRTLRCGSWKASRTHTHTHTHTHPSLSSSPLYPFIPSSLSLSLFLLHSLLLSIQLPLLLRFMSAQVAMAVSPRSEANGTLEQLSELLGSESAAEMSLGLINALRPVMRSGHLGLLKEKEREIERERERELGKIRGSLTMCVMLLPQ